MTRQEVLALVDRLILPLLDAHDVEEIAVREEEDWSGAPSLWIDVFVRPGMKRPETETWTRAKLRFSDALVEADEPRFPYIRFRDRRAESEDFPGEAA